MTADRAMIAAIADPPQTRGNEHTARDQPGVLAFERDALEEPERMPAFDALVRRALAS
jgi:hypothetical protein